MMQHLKLVRLTLLLFILSVLQQWVSANFYVKVNDKKTALVDSKEVKFKFQGVGTDYPGEEDVGRAMSLKIGGCRFKIIGKKKDEVVHFYYTLQEAPATADTDTPNPTGFTVKENVLVAEGKNGPKKFDKCRSYEFEKTDDNKYKLEINFDASTLADDFRLEVEAKELTSDMKSGTDAASISYWLVVGLPIFIVFLILLSIIVSIIVVCCIRKRRNSQGHSSHTSQQTVEKVETNKITDQQEGKQQDVERQKDEKSSNKETQVSQYTTIERKSTVAPAHEHLGQHDTKFCNECFMLKPNRVMSIIED